MSAEAIEAAARIVAAEDFYKPAHTHVFPAICALHRRGEPADPVTVSAELRRADLLEVVGGAGTLLALQASTVSIGAAPVYARDVRELALRRRLIHAANDIASAAWSDSQDPTGAVDRAVALADNLNTATRTGPKTSWAPIDLGPVLTGEDAGPEPGVLYRADGLGLLYDGKVHVVAGEPESGKSWLVQLATSEVLKVGGKVAYVDFEDDAAGVLGRLRALGVAPDLILGGLAYLRPDQALDDQGGHHLDQACTGATLAVVDGTTEGMSLHGWAPKNDVDVALWQTRILRRIAAHGCSVVAIDHVVKDKEGRGRWATGSQHKLAGIDGAQYLVETRKPWAPGRSGVARITIVKDRPGRVRAGLEDMRTVADMAVSAWPDGGVTITLTATTPPERASDGGHRPTVLMERVSAFLAAHDGKADPSGNGVRQGVRGDNSAIDRALTVLEMEGYITSTRQGQGTYWRHLKPFTSTSTGDDEDA